MRRHSYSRFLLCALGALCGESVASAAPAVTHLFPAGAQRGTTVEVTAAGTFDKWPVWVWVGGQGVAAQAGKEKGKLAVTVAADAVPGTYWLRLADDTGASGLRPFIVGTLPEIAEKEPNDEPAKAQPVEPPAAVVNGRLEKSGDVDCFAVQLRKGQTLVAAVEANRTLRSPMDAVLQVVSADGFVLEQANDRDGLDPLVAFTAPRDGTYVARVFAFPATPDSSIRFFGSDACVYRLTLTTGGFADHAWPLAVSHDKPRPVALVGWNIPVSATALRVPAAEPGRAVTVFHPQVANAALVNMEPHPCWEAAELRGRVEPLAPPFTISGRSAGQGDRFPVAGKKGQPLTVRAEGPSLGFAITPVVTVSDAAGKVLARGEPAKLGADAELTFTPPQDGAYTVAVRDLHRAAGPRYAYRLTVRPPQPDFRLSVPSDRIGCAPGTPGDVVVTVARRDGFTGDVKLAVEGLPDGVSAGVVPPTAKPDPAKVTLRFTAAAAYIPRPVRVVGTAAGRERIATAALPEFSTTAEDLWLSPGAAPPPAPKKRK